MPCTAKQRRLIRAVFDTVPEVESSFRTARGTVYALALASERQHRRPVFTSYGRMGHPPAPGFSADTAARYFTVKWLADYAKPGAKLPDIGAVMSIRSECYTAAAWVALEPGTLRAWSLTIPKEFFALDYAELMKGTQ